MYGDKRTEVVASGFPGSREKVAQVHFTSGRQTLPTRIDLDDHVIDVGIPFVHQRNEHAIGADVRGLAQSKNAKWVPDGAKTPHYQRSPFSCVDNFAIRVVNGEPCVVLGLWDKEKEVNGAKVRIRGLVLAGGGHYEIMGRPRPNETQLDYGMNKYYTFKEPGHMSEREAADAELKEEIGMDRRHVLYTEKILTYDSVLRDPLKHCVGSVYFRFIDRPPGASEELKQVFLVPVSRVVEMVRGETFPISMDDEVRLVLGHDKLLKWILTLPNVHELLEKARRFATL